MGVYVSFDEPLIVTCHRCGGGRGDFVNPCDWCGATGGVPIDCAHDQLATLAHNLAIGAALCFAHMIALDEAEDHRLYHEHGYRTWQCWSPGCGRRA